MLTLPPEFSGIAELVPAFMGEIAGRSQPLVNARDLYAFLDIAKDFSDWIKTQIERARLRENEHFEVFPFLGENLAGGRPRIEYRLNLDAAKHIAMISNTERGFEVRDYFIACERGFLESAARPAAPEPTPLVQRLQREMMAIRPTYIRIMHYHAVGLPPGDIALLLNKTPAKAAATMRDMHEMGFLPLDFVRWAERIARQASPPKATKPPKHDPRQLPLPLPAPRAKPALRDVLNYAHAHAYIHTSAADLDAAKRTVIALIREMSKRVAIGKAIDAFNQAYVSGTLPFDVMEAATLAFSDKRGCGVRPGLTRKTFYNWEARFAATDANAPPAHPE